VSTEELERTARALVAPGKGILAIDETVGTCTKRFQQAGIESTEASRAAYRSLFATTPGIGEYIGGAILFDETIRQTTPDGTPIIQVLEKAGVSPGIKVDRGTKQLGDATEETVTEGLDGLRERLEEYRSLGARFAKWRAVIRIGEGMPTSGCIEANAQALGAYAALAQETGMVPIVEPEVLMEGGFDVERDQEVTEAVLQAVFQELTGQGVALEGVILKPNMVTAGSKCASRAETAEIAERTLATLRRCVPVSVPGIAFLSGGMTGEQACANLSAMNADGGLPWRLIFSFGRALQYPALELWGGEEANVAAAQAAFLHRARMSSLASTGAYTPDAERSGMPSSR
jgi:fructose-bisphosphate aldolase class I